MNVSIREYAQDKKIPSHKIMRTLRENGYKPRNIMQKMDINILNKLCKEEKKEFRKDFYLYDLREFEQLDRTLEEIKLILK